MYQPRCQSSLQPGAGPVDLSQPPWLLGVPASTGKHRPGATWQSWEFGVLPRVCACYQDCGLGIRYFLPYFTSYWALQAFQLARFLSFFFFTLKVGIPIRQDSLSLS